MGVRINNNIIALNSLRHLNLTTDRLGTSVERLSSGLRINRAADDPAGLTISEKLRAQVDGVKRASLNAQDGVSMLQVAEGALSEVSSILQRVRELTVQAANGVYTDDDRLEIQSEVDQLIAEVDRVASETEFNTRRLLDGTATGLWSSDKNDMQVVFRGIPQAGNYAVEKSNSPGKAHVLKSDIFGLANGATRGRATDVQQIVASDIQQSIGVPELNQSHLQGFSNLEINTPPLQPRDFQIALLNPPTNQVALVDHRYVTPGARNFLMTPAGAMGAGESGYYTLEITDVMGGNVLDGSANTVTAVASHYSASGQFIESDTITDTKANITGANYAWFSGLATANATRMRLGTAGNTIQTGDRWLIAVSAAADFAGNVVQLRQEENGVAGWTPDTTGAGAAADTSEDRVSVYTQAGALTGGASLATNLAYFSADGGLQFSSGVFRLGETTSIPTLGTVEFNLAKGVGPLNQADFTNFTGLEFTKLPNGALGNANRDFRIGVMPPGHAVDQVAVVDHYYGTPGARVGFSISTPGALTAGQSGYYELEIIDVDGGSLLDTSSSSVTVAARKYSANGLLLDSKRITTTKNDISSAGIAWFSSLESGLATTVQLGGIGDRLESGDRWLFTVNSAADVPAGNNALQLRHDRSDDGGFSPDTTGATVRTAGIQDRISLYTVIGPTLSGGASYDTSLAYYNQSGQLQFGTGNFRLGRAGTIPPAGDIDFNLFETSLAERTTQLKGVDRFQADGGTTLLEVGRPLSIYANGHSARIILQGSDTLEQLAEKIRDALVSPPAAGGLGLGVDGNLRRYSINVSMPAGVDGNTAVYVDDPLEGGDESIEGTIAIRSTVPDEEGRITIAGDSKLVQALSLATIQEPTDNFLEVTVRNAHTGILVGSQVVSDGVVRNLIPGVDLVIDQSVDTAVTFDETRRAIALNTGVGTAVEYLHIVDSALRLQTGANEGQILQASIGQVDALALGVDGLLVVSADRAKGAIASADRAIGIVSRERSKLGAYLNRLDITQRILDVQAENLSSSESRIRDLDIAEQTVDFTRDQILQQAGTALLAQANALPQSVLQLLK